MPLDQLLSESDFVTVHVPETPETVGLLDSPRLALLRPSACLVNVTSPAVVEQDALTSALRAGRLAGAALDVHEAHPIPPNSPFLGLPNVNLTPHIGGATIETVVRHSRMVVDDLGRFLRGRRPRRLANPDVWPRRRSPRSPFDRPFVRHRRTQGLKAHADPSSASGSADHTFPLVVRRVYPEHVEGNHGRAGGISTERGTVLQVFAYDWDTVAFDA